MLRLIRSIWRIFLRVYSVILGHGVSPSLNQSLSLHLYLSLSPSLRFLKSSKRMSRQRPNRMIGYGMKSLLVVGVCLQLAAAFTFRLEYTGVRKAVLKKERLLDGGMFSRQRRLLVVV